MDIPHFPTFRYLTLLLHQMLMSEFSVEVKEVIKASREIALDLGYNYISTMHFLLADCRLDGLWSIRKFAFKEDKGFLSAYENFRKGPAIINTADSLHLTKEAEQAIRRSAMERFIFSEKIISPYHIFLAAAKMKNSSIQDFFSNNPNLYEHLVAYYSNLNLIDPDKAKGLFKQIIQKFPFRYLITAR